MREIITRGVASIYIDVPALRPRTIGAYSFAFVCTGIAAVLQVAIDPYLAGAHYITFFLAVIVTTLIGGFGAGLFCLALSVAAVDFFLFQPRFSFHVDLVEVPSLLIFTLAGLSSVILITGMRFAVERKRLQASKTHLQLALDTARLGWWQCDLLRHAAWGDPRFKEIFGLTCDERRLVGERPPNWNRVFGAGLHQGVLTAKASPCTPSERSQLHPVR